ncbi:MAG: hypothetical protein IPK35_16490 [Saprospiraceae bacterium]|jgi:outer membrane murein-binding lipoprotein Lpp|nr:hypothetical protein [Saprospiraceae bacterium]
MSKKCPDPKDICLVVSAQVANLVQQGGISKPTLENIESHVCQVSDANTELSSTNLDSKRTQLNAKIEYLESKIDELVCEVYCISYEQLFHI